MALEVENFYEKIKDGKDPNEKNPGFKVHGIKIPFRILIVGSSGSMKTNAALDLCKKFSDTFSHITIATRNIKEPLYRYMTDKIPEDQLTIIEIEEDDLSALPKMGDLDENAEPTLLIFDDLVLMKNQLPIVEYFIRCRKYNMSVLYLTQSYFTTPKTIRGNCNSIILKKINSQNDLRMILAEYSLSVTLPELVKMHQESTKDPKDWLMIRMDNQSGDQFYHNYKRIETGKTGETNDAMPKQRVVSSKLSSSVHPAQTYNDDESSESTIDYGDSDSDQDRAYHPQSPKRRKKNDDIIKLFSNPKFQYKRR